MRLKFAFATLKRMLWAISITRTTSRISRSDARNCSVLAAAAIERLKNADYFLVVVKVDVRYKKPARYDDLLDLKTTISRITPARIEHEYELRRDGELLTTATSTLACVDSMGVVTALPDELLQSSE